MFSRLCSPLTLLGLASVAAASPTSSSLVVHETLVSAPPGFTLKGPADGSSALTLRLALNSQDLSGLEKVLYDVSTPSSASYGEHLTKEEVEAYVAPSEQATSAVNDWLSSEGLSSTIISPSGNWIAIDTTVAKANELLGTTFNVYTHDTTGKETTRALSYSVPSVLTGDIELIHPTIAFPIYNPKAPLTSKRPLNSTATRRTRKRQGKVPASCLANITPTCIQALYGVPSTPAPATTPSNGIAVAGFLQQWPQTSDLQTFLSLFRPDMDDTTTFILQEIDGGADPQGSGDAGEEADLDVQYTIGLATDVPVYFISAGSDNEDGIDGFLDMVNFILSESTLPWVLTTSYAFNEPDLTFSLANNLCNAYMQLGARGITTFFASGDGGVSGGQLGDCSTFVPTFPSTCPFVTSVGATEEFGPEMGTEFSSGGFSNFFGRPSYQADAVETFLNLLGTYEQGLYNASGRGFPDVSAQGMVFNVVVGGETTWVDGTSCSAPTFASVVALLNNELLAAGKSTLGFLNPLLYANPDILTDIDDGFNPGCNTGGFIAETGWDPVTGLGTPLYPKMLSLVTA